MKKYKYLKVLAATVFVTCFAQAASAEKVLKLGTVGFVGMPIGDAIDQALIPTLEKVSGGKMKIEPHYRKSLCSEQSCGEQANQGLIALWTSSTANFGNFGTALWLFSTCPSSLRVSKMRIEFLQRMVGQESNVI